MIPVPGPVAPPNGMVPYSLLPDLESFISMVFTAFWMQNLIFPLYLHQFGWRTSYFHGMYNILDAAPHISIRPILPTGPILPTLDYTTVPITTYRTSGGDYLQDPPNSHIHRGEGGNHDHWGGSPNLEHIYMYMYVCMYVYVYIYIY